ncbi:ABC transporter ATP-binding protein [Marivirga arenosa]|uniref:ABC transporter ATP-binding protein n=1 Tax=Marivirga arenosa TaxID=3059076 RepID=A0AA49GFW9_9BACT|nr:ABC transporter ATP-binding protein [Marivirga sp. ABR2-2]WKK85595.2 ABC transporter ATP-binding protein [Marivirga sp. ABR2-2]
MITLNSISKKYSKVIGLEQVNIDLPKNNVIGLIGKNGSGKSTFIKIITGLITDYKGNVNYNGLKLNEISLASENFGFPSRFTVKKVIKIFKFIKKADNQQVEKVIEQLELCDELNKKVSVLSQGNKQRLNIACAILGNPKLVILDEPNNGLDPSGFIMLRQLVLDLKAKGKTVIIASHLLNEIEEVCDHILFLNEGRVLIDEKKSELVKSFGSLEKAYLQLIKN